MKQSLQLRTSQHLALTPQLQQSIRLLQLSTLELHQELEQLLTDNPLLERLDDPLDHSLRLLSDGALSSTAAPAEAPPQPPGQDAPAAPAEAETFDGEAGEGPAAADGGEPVPLDPALHRAVHGVEEVVAVVLGVERKQVIPEHPGE